MVKMANREIKFVELDKLLARVETPMITIDSMILLLLFAKKDEPIISRTLLFKELFLFYKEILEKMNKRGNIADPEFTGCKFGPFSFLMADVLANLWVGGMVKVEGRAKGATESFMLTSNGEKRARALLKDMPKTAGRKMMNELSDKRVGWDQLGRDGILRYVYNNYTDYTKESKIKNRYKELRWGQLFKE